MVVKSDTSNYVDFDTPGRKLCNCYRDIDLFKVKMVYAAVLQPFGARLNDY